MKLYLIPLLLLVIGCSGCNGKPPAKPSQTGNDIARIGVHGSDIAMDAESLRPYVLPPGISFLESIVRKAGSIISASAIAQKNHADDLAKLDWYDTKYAEVCQALKDEQGHIIGYQARLWGKVILAAVLAGAAALYAWRAFFPASLVGRGLGHLLPWGTLFGKGGS